MRSANGHDADGELTAVSDNNSSYEYTYNADGEETSQSDAGSPDLPTVTLTYEYDADGNRTSMDDSLGGLVSYTYNGRDELTNETPSGTDISAMAVANTYDNAGNMTGQTRYSNLAETTVVAATSYTYDAANQMTGTTDKNSSGTTLVSYGYTYDAAGLVSQETRTWTVDSELESDTLDYTYTANDQLTGVTHTDHSFANESFSYDANGNETGSGYTTSTGNEQTASPGYTYTYDADGNMITSTQTSTGDVWTYSYNLRGQMAGAVETNSEDTVLNQVTYTYDALGNRIGMDENGTQTWTLYEGTTPEKGKGVRKRGQESIKKRGQESIKGSLLRRPRGRNSNSSPKKELGGAARWGQPLFVVSSAGRGRKPGRIGNRKMGQESIKENGSGIN